MEKLQIDYSSQFLSDISNPTNELEVFYFRLINSDTAGLKETPIAISTDRLNEDYYVINLNNDSIGLVLPDNMLLSDFDTINLYYKINGTYKIAARINIIQNSSSILYDYTYNYIYLDLRELGVVARINLVKLFPGGSTETPIYGTIINHKHSSLIQDYNSELPVTNNTYSSEAIIKKLNDNNNDSYVKYLNRSNIYGDHIISSDNNFYISDVTVPVNQLILKNFKPSLYTITNNSKDVYQFKNSYITLLGIELKEEKPNSFYEQLATDYNLLTSMIGELMFTLSDTEFNIVVSNDDLVEKTLTLNIYSDSEYDSSLSSTSNYVSIIKNSSSNYNITFTPIGGINSEGFLTLRVWDENSSITKSIPWSIIWR